MSVPFRRITFFTFKWKKKQSFIVLLEFRANYDRKGFFRLQLRLINHAFSAFAHFFWPKSCLDIVANTKHMIKIYFKWKINFSQQQQKMQPKEVVGKVTLHV